MARFQSIRLLISIAAVKNFEIYQFDIKCGFLYGKVDEEIYMEQPTGFHDGTDRYCLLNRSLYGLKQSPRQWNKKSHSVLVKFGLTATQSDQCVYTSADKDLYLALYVDDGLVIGNSITKIESFINELKTQFKMKCEKATCYLGIEIERDDREKSIRIHQTAYARSIMEKFGM